jgi:hypothetical protein
MQDPKLDPLRSKRRFHAFGKRVDLESFEISRLEPHQKNQEIASTKGLQT